MTNPKENYLTHKKEILKAVHRVLDGGMYVGGEAVASFEEEWAGYNRSRHCVAVANGTDAIALALKACGVGRGDEVVTVSYTVSATVAAILLVGADPILVDIDPATMTMDPWCLEKAITERTKAVVPVHLFGRLACMEAINAVALANDLWVVEDCAHAHGLKDWPGHIQCWSFYPTKNLGALGDAGAITTNNMLLADKVRQLRQYGWGPRYETVVEGGCNSRMDSMQAAILRAKLKYLDEEVQRRRELARIYREELSASELWFPACYDGHHAYHKFTVRHPERDDLVKTLAFLGVPTEVYYRVPVHLQPAYYDKLMHVGSMTSTEKAASECVSLPLWPEMPERHAKIIAKLIKLWERGEYKYGFSC